MQCSVTESDRHRGNVKMKTVTNYKNPYKKEPNFENIVDQLCTRLQDIEDQKGASQLGMPTCSVEQTEAVRRYYAAFPALKKGRDSPLQYYLPPPAWCHKSAPNQVKMQCELSPTRDWNARNKKFSTGKERRNSYHGQRRNKKRCNSYSRSFESKDSLPEWVTYEGAWDMETQDPVKEFIRAIALDEGYGTCENTVTDEIRLVTGKLHDTAVPEWDDVDIDAEWPLAELAPRPRSPTDDELYAKFEAKFDRTIEALWATDQNTPDDEYQDLPIDFHELLSSPSDCLPGGAPAAERGASALPDRLRPLNLADAEPAALELDSFALYDGDDIYEALAAVAGTMRSFTAINHSRDTSGFVEVPPRRARPPHPPPPPPPPPPLPPAAEPPGCDREDLLTSARTHFRPIRRESDAPPPRYADGDTFDIRGELDTVEERRSASGGVYLGESGEQYLEYRATRTIHYGRLNLTAAQRCPDLEDAVGLRLRFPLRQRDAAAQTDRASPRPATPPPPPPPAPAPTWGACEECGRAAKKMRGIESIWSEGVSCAACSAPAEPAAGPAAPDELSHEWEELLSDISAAHARYAAGEEAGEAEGGEEPRADRKRRHSAALRCAPACTHPHARFLPCCALALANDRPLTR